MSKPDPGFDYYRYRQLLAEAVDDPKRLALIELMIEERAKDRLKNQRISNQEADTGQIIAKPLGKYPVKSTSSANSVHSATSTSPINESRERPIAQRASNPEMNRSLQTNPRPMIVKLLSDDPVAQSTAPLNPAAPTASAIDLGLDIFRIPATGPQTSTSHEMSTKPIAANVLSKDPVFAQKAAPANSAIPSTSAIDHGLDIFHIPTTGPLG